MRSSPKPDLSRGDRVTVHEDGLRTWEGVVADVKPGGMYGRRWYVSIVKDEDGMTWVVNAEHVRK